MNVTRRVQDFWFHAVNSPRNWWERHPALTSMITATGIVGLLGLFDEGVGTALSDGFKPIVTIGLLTWLLVHEKRAPVRRRQELQRRAEEAQRQAAWELWFSQQPHWKRELVLAKMQQQTQADLAHRMLFTAAMIASMQQNGN